MTLRSPASRTDADARVTALVKRHGASLLKTAKAVSLCADDAHDAYQRALEIYLRRLEDLDPLTEAAYMRVVVRNEALRLCRERQEHVAEPGDLDARAGDLPPAEDRLEREERARRAAEVLRDLKPDEARALLLQAQGHSYSEIGERFGWTYTKVNRSVTEGRKRFRTLYAGIESGEACDALAPVLAAVAGGRAGSEELLRLRPHLRHCARCRAEVRRLHGGRLSRVAGFLPLPGLFDRVRAEVAGVLARFAEPLAAGAASGGGRGTTAVAAVVAVCLGGLGAGCVVTGVTSGPAPSERSEKRDGERRQSARSVAGATASEAASTPAATAAPRRPVARAAERRPARLRPAATKRARARRAAPARRSPTPAPPTAPAEEFVFENRTPAATAPAAVTPAAASPATASPAADAASFETSPSPAPAPKAGGDFGFEG